MNLGEYFDNAKGHGVLATADADGKVNAAMYARPYFADHKTAVFIMAERLTHANLKTNPWATYLFIESGPGYSGKRLYLKKQRRNGIHCSSVIYAANVTIRIITWATSTSSISQSMRFCP